MWLINTETLELHRFMDASEAPAYAILSHTWGEYEMTLKDFRKKRNCTGRGYEKIKSCCAFARAERWFDSGALRNGFKWAWIDTV
jgi:hypothetical protein